MSDRPADALQSYLSDLRTRLRGLPGTEVDEILEELRAHVRDSLAGGGDPAEALRRLGSPAELASLYVTDRLLTRAAHTPSAGAVLRALARWASRGVAGSAALAGVLVGYLLAASFFLAALVKPFAPRRVGLWWMGGDEVSLWLGFSGLPPTGREVLGWWIVPLGLGLGAAALWLAPRFGAWAIRTFRPSSGLPAR